MGEHTPGFEDVNERRWPLLELPDDPALHEQLRQAAASCAEQIAEGEEEQSNLWVILRHDYDRNLNTGGPYKKTEAYLRLALIDELLEESRVDSADLRQRLHHEPELVNQVFTIKLYDPIALDNMLFDAARAIDDYVSRRSPDLW